MGYLGDEYQSVPSLSSKTVSFRPLSGLVNCGKLIPLQYAPITIELEVCNSITDPIMSVNDEACGVVCKTVGSLIKNTSQDWRIENPNIKCDVCVLDSALNNEYAALLLSGKALLCPSNANNIRSNTISEYHKSVIKIKISFLNC